MHDSVSGRLQTRRWDDPDTGDVRFRTEIITTEAIFLGGIQQNQVPPDYYLAEGEERLPEADNDDAPIDDRDSTAIDA